MAKRKTKTEVTYDVEFFSHWRCAWQPWASEHKTLKSAREEAQQCAFRVRIVRVERTVVAEVKP